MSEIITSTIEIASGVVSSGLTVDMGGEVSVLPGGTVTNTEVVNYGFLWVEEGGSIRDISLKNSGNAFVFGSAENLTMTSGGQVDVYTGCLRSGSVLDKGFGVVWSQGSGLNMTVSSGGRYLVYGGYVGDTVVESGGSFTIQMSGGIAAGTVVNSGGHARVVSGAQGSQTMVNGGRLEMLYGYMYDTVVASGGSMEIISGQAYNTDINAGGTLYVAAAGEAHTAIVNSGYLNVQSGTVYDANIQRAGSALLQDAAAFRFNLNGGTAQALSGTVITEGDLNGGTLDLGSGAILLSANLNGAALNAEAGALVSRAHLKNAATALNAVSGATFSRTIVTAGTMTVLEGAIVAGTTVSENGALVAGAAAEVADTTVNTGGKFILNGGTARDVSVNGSAGTSIYPYIFGDASSSTSSSSAATGGMFHVASGGVATDVRVTGGTVNVSDGLVSGLTMSNGSVGIGAGGIVRNAVLKGTGGGYIYIVGTGDVDGYGGGYGGGGAIVPIVGGYGGAGGDGATYGDILPDYILGPTIIINPYPINTNPGSGFLTVSSGGLLEDAEAEQMQMTVTGGGVVRNLAASQQTRIELASGGLLTGRLSFMSGTTVTAATGGIIDFDLSLIGPGAEALLVKGANAVIAGAPTYTITVSDVQATGRYVLAEGVTGFSDTLTVRNTDWNTLGTLTVGMLTEIGGRYYLANEKRGSLYLTIWTEQPELIGDPETVYLNTNWTGLENGTIVVLADGSTATFGYNAFADMAGAGEAVAANGTVLVIECAAALSGEIGWNVAAAVGASVTGGTIGANGTLTVKSGATARDVAVNGGTLTVEAGAVLTVTQQFSASSGTITVNGIVNLDISGSTGNTNALLTNFSKIQGTPTYRLTVGTDQAVGGYKMASLASTSDYSALTLTVVDTAGAELGTVRISYTQQADGSWLEQKTDLVIGGKRYSLQKTSAYTSYIIYDISYTLTIKPETEKPYYLYVNSSYQVAGSTVNVANPDTGMIETVTIGYDAFGTLEEAVAAGDENCTITITGGGTFSPASGLMRDTILNNSNGIVENTTVMRSLTVNSGTVRNLTVAAGAALNIMKNGTLTATGTCTFEAGSTVTIDGHMEFNLTNRGANIPSWSTTFSGLTPGDVPLYDGLAYVSGTPNCLIRVASDQRQGAYVLAVNAAGFAPYFTITDSSYGGYVSYNPASGNPRPANVITVGGTYRVNGKSYTIAETDGVLTLTVGSYEMPETVYVNSAWDGLAFGTEVTLQNGGTATFGVDAFDSIDAAWAAESMDGTAYIDGGTFNLSGLDTGRKRNTVVLGGAVVSGRVQAGSWNLTLEAGATGSGLEIGGNVTVKSGATLAGDNKFTRSFTLENGAIVAGGTVTADGKTILRDVTSLGGTLVVTSSGTLSGTAVFTEDMDITVNGCIDFDISGTTAGAPMLFRGLSCLKGTASAYTITVSGYEQGFGVYLLADGVNGFNGTLTVRDADGRTLGTLAVGTTLEVSGICYTLRGLPFDGKYFLSLVVSDERPPLDYITVNSSWGSRRAGDVVNVRGGTAIYMYDAFSNLEDAFAAVTEGTTVGITGGNFQLSEGSYSNPVVVDGTTLSLGGTDVLTGPVSVSRNGCLTVTGEAVRSASITVDGTSTLILARGSDAASLTVNGMLVLDVTGMTAGGSAAFADLSRIQGAPTFAVRTNGTPEDGTYLIATGASGIGTVELQIGRVRYTLSTNGGNTICGGARYEINLTETGDLVMQVSRPEPGSVIYVNAAWSNRANGEIVTPFDGGTACVGFNAFSAAEAAFRAAEGLPSATIIAENGAFTINEDTPLPYGANLSVRGGNVYLYSDCTVASGRSITLERGTRTYFYKSLTVESGAIVSVDVYTVLELHNATFDGGSIFTVSNGAAIRLDDTVFVDGAAFTVNSDVEFEVHGAVFSEGASITVNGRIIFNTVNLSGGCDALISGFSRIQGAPTYELWISQKQSVGKYILATDAAGFNGTINLDIHGGSRGTVGIGSTFELGSKACELVLDESGELSLNVFRIKSSPLVHVNPDWKGMEDDTVIWLPDGGTAYSGFSAFGSLAEAISSVTEGGTVVLWNGAYFTGTMGKANIISVRGGSLNLTGTVGEGKTITAEAGGTLCGTIAAASGGTVSVASNGTLSGTVTVDAGGTLTVDAGGTFSVANAAIAEGANITVNGTLRFDISGTTAGNAAILAGLNRIQGAPACQLTISGREADGSYMLASGAAGFDGVFSVRLSSDDQLGTLSADGTLQVGRRNYSLVLDESGDLSLIVSSLAPAGVVHIGAAWRGLKEGITVSLPDGTPVMLGYDAFSGADALSEAAEGGTAFLWNGSVSVSDLGNVNGVVIRGGEFKLNGTVGEGKTITVASGGKFSGFITVEAGGAITVEEGGTLSVSRALLKPGGSIFVNGTLNFDISGRSEGAGALFNGLARVQGTPTCTLTVKYGSTDQQATGKYILSQDAGLFDGEIIVQSSGGVQLGTLAVGGSLVIGDRVYSLSNDGSGNLSVTISRPSLVYVNSEWKGLAAGTAVVLSNGQYGTIGVDAFADSTAFSVVAPDGTLILEKGEFAEAALKGDVIVLGEVSIFGCTVGAGRTITVAEGARLNGAFIVNYGGAITVEEGGTLSSYFYSFKPGASVMVNGTFDHDISKEYEYTMNDIQSGFSCIRGDYTLTATVDIANGRQGRFILATNKAEAKMMADKVFTIVDITGETLGTVSAETRLEYGDWIFGMDVPVEGTGLVSTSIWMTKNPDNPPPNVTFVNSEWDGLADGTTVSIAFRKRDTAVIGYDAFASFDTAAEAVSPSTDATGVVVLGGTNTAHNPIHCALEVMENAYFNADSIPITARSFTVSGYAENIVLTDTKLKLYGIVKNLTMSNWRADLRIGKNAKLTGCLTFLGGTAWLDAGSTVDFDLSVADEMQVLVNDLSFLTSNVVRVPEEGDMSLPNIYFTITADPGAVPASGSVSYKLAAGAEGFDSAITVVNRAGDELGTITAGGKLSVEGVVYRLWLADDILLLTVSAPDGVPPEVVNVRANIVTPTVGDVIVTAGFQDDVEVAAAYYRIGEEGEWTEYVSSVTVTENATVYFKAVDAAGNVSEIVSCTVSNIDRTPPTITVSASTTAPAWSVTVTADIQDASTLSEAYCRIGEDGEWIAYQSGSGVTVMKNTTVYFKAVDAVGNASEVVSYSVDNIDKVPPEAPDHLRANVSEHLVVLAWNAAEDEGAGIDAYTVRFWNGEQDFTVATTKTIFVIEHADAGEWHWSVTASDKAGNASGIADGGMFLVTGEAVPEEAKRFFPGDFAGDGKPMFAKYAGGIVSVYAEIGGLWGAVALGDGWEPAGIGDFNGDGKDDILRVNEAGYVVGEMSTGDGTFKAQVLNFLGAGWDLLGIGDFDGDGKDDVLVGNPTAAAPTVGLLGYWKGGVEWTLINGYSDAWEVVTTGDFTGDGKCDMIWRNSFTGDDGKTYNAYCTWVMYPQQGESDWRMISVANPEEWNFLCAGDFDGDGTKDIAMVNGEGVVGIWGVTAGYLGSWSILSKVDASEWSLIGVADLNGDGTDDIAWRNAESGLVGYWQIENKELVSWQNSALIS